MIKRSTWYLAVGAICVLAWTAPQANPLGGNTAVDLAAGPAVPSLNLLDVSVTRDNSGRSVVSLTSDGEVAYQSFVLDGPDRLVIDLHGVVNRLDQFRLSVGDGGLSRVRAAQHTVEPVAVTRVVFDLEAALSYQIEQDQGVIRVSFGDGDDLDRSVAGSRSIDTDRAVAPIAATTADLDTDPTLEQIEPDRAAVIEVPVVNPQARELPAIDIPVTEMPDELAAETDFEEIGTVELRMNAEEPSRAVEENVIDRLLSTTPRFDSPQDSDDYKPVPDSFTSRTIVTDQIVYSGRRISLNLVDADIKQIFRLFHEISGLNFVLDPSVSGRVTIVLDQVPWDQALDIILKNNGLDKVLENNVLRIASTQKLAQEAASRRQLRDAQELEVEPVTLTRTLSYATAQDVERVIRNGGILSARGSVIVDERTNTLIISDVPKKIEPLDALIDTLDAETPQVMIEARIVETSRSYSRSLGVVWGFSAIADASRGTSTGNSLFHNTALKYGLNLPGNGGASALGFSLGNIVDSFTLDIALNTLEQEGQGRILSSPKIATQNNERAEIEQGVRIPIVNTTATEINVEFVSASLRLMVTPQITAEGTIILDVEVENNSPDFVNTSGDVPSIRTQRAQTKVLISDGGTTVIGGIFVVNEGKSETGVPWFRKIPVFGWLFKTQDITSENRELLIFITPKIVKLS